MWRGDMNSLPQTKEEVRLKKLERRALELEGLIAHLEHLEVERMTTGVQNKRLLEDMAESLTQDHNREAAAWALKEIEFLQGKVKEIRTLLAAAEQRAG